MKCVICHEKYARSEKVQTAINKKLRIEEKGLPLELGSLCDACFLKVNRIEQNEADSSFGFQVMAAVGKEDGEPTVLIDTLGGERHVLTPNVARSLASGIVEAASVAETEARLYTLLESEFSKEEANRLLDKFLNTLKDDGVASEVSLTGEGMVL